MPPSRCATTSCVPVPRLVGSTCRRGGRLQLNARWARLCAGQHGELCLCDALGGAGAVAASRLTCDSPQNRICHRGFYHRTVSLQPNEVLIVVLVALIVLGPKRLPAAIRSIGQVFRQVREFSTTVRQEIDATLTPPKVDPTSGPATTDASDPPTVTESVVPDDNAQLAASTQTEHSAHREDAADPDGAEPDRAEPDGDEPDGDDGTAETDRTNSDGAA